MKGFRGGGFGQQLLPCALVELVLKSKRRTDRWTLPILSVEIATILTNCDAAAESYE